MMSNVNLRPIQHSAVNFGRFGFLRGALAVLLAGALERLGVPVVEEGAALALSISTDGRALRASAPEERVRTALAEALSSSPAAPTGPGLYCVDPAFVLDADGLCAGAVLAVLGA